LPVDAFNATRLDSASEAADAVTKLTISRVGIGRAGFSSRVVALRVHRRLGGVKIISQDNQDNTVSEPNDRYIQIPSEDREKARRFFEKADAVGAAGQYDYAVDMYLQGLTFDPEAVEIHQKLRDTALRRKASGGKKLGMFEKMKFTGKSKDEKQNLLNAERLLAIDDPGNLDYMDSMMQSAYKSGCFDTALWVMPIYEKGLADSGKNDFARLQRLRDHYANLYRWSDAVRVCQAMLRIKPEEMDLKNDLKNLSAKEAMEKGNYEKARSFRDSVRDLNKQQSLLEADKDVSGEEFLIRQVKEAESQLAADPKELGKMMRLIEALQKVGKPEYEQRALQKLEEFYQSTGQFRFRQRMFETRLKMFVNEDRVRRADLASAPADPEKQQAWKDWIKSRAEEELAIFQEVSDQYPTESKFRFEIAERMVRLDRFSDAIPLYQQVMADPKLRNQATLKLGQAFLAAEFVDEAIDTLRTLQESYQVRGDDLAKEIYYWYARATEARNDLQTASKSYSQVAQWDFNYRDVQSRIKSIRAKLAGSGV
jgi:hypothetical protein